MECEHVFGQADLATPRSCARCGRDFTAEEVRQTIWPGAGPLCWRCPACSRAHAARIDVIAEVLVRGHQRHGWIGTAEHTPYDECVFCEALLVVTERVLRTRGVP